jgi:hypothetical protein
MNTREDVINTIHDLVRELQENEPSWENPTLPQYLEAMAAWLEGYGNKHNPTPSWEFIIQLLSAAKIYE